MDFLPSWFKGLGTVRARLARKALTHKLQDWSGVASQNVAQKSAREANLKKEFPLHEVYENLKMLLKKVGGGQISKGNPFKRNFWKPQNYSQKLHMNQCGMNRFAPHFFPKMDQ